MKNLNRIIFYQRIALLLQMRVSSAFKCQKTIENRQNELILQLLFKKMKNLKLQKEFFQIIDEENLSNSQILSNLQNLGQFRFPELFQNPLFLYLSKTHLILSQKIPLSSVQYALPFSFDLTISEILDDSNPENIKKGFKLLIAEKDSTQFFVETSEFNFEQIMKKIAVCIKMKGFHNIFSAARKIGNGNFAKVYEALRLKDNKKFAIKAFNKLSITSMPKGRQIFQQEFSVLRHLNHPNILKLESMHESDNSIYVAVELIRGATMIQLLKEDKKLSHHNIAAFLKSIVQTLSYLSEKGIAHRDLKLQNIIIRNYKINDPVIIDFGLAVYCKNIPYTLNQCGTPGYVAPQIFSRNPNEPLTPLSDIFSLGVIFYILLTNKPLFYSLVKDFKEVQKKNKDCTYKINEQEINHVALDLLKKMLEKDPSQRINHKQILEHPYLIDKEPSQITIIEEV